VQDVDEAPLPDAQCRECFVVAIDHYVQLVHWSMKVRVTLRPASFVPFPSMRTNFSHAS